jgi:LPXTG-site transpeptidase (sortase) family protein
MSRSRLPSNRGRSSSLILRLIVLGVVLGVAFLVVQRLRHPPEPPPTVAAFPTLTPSPVPTRQPTAVPIPTNTAYPRANLSAPSVGISADIVDVYLDGQSWDVQQLGNNIGHLQGTGWFGKVGNIGLAGHVELADGREGIFRNLEKMAKGDPIYLKLGDLQQNYKVTEVKRANPNDLTILEPSTVDTITLITCDIGAYNLLQNSYLDRIVVVAERVQSS